MKKLFALLCLALALCSKAHANTRTDVQQLAAQIVTTEYAYHDAWDADPTNETLHGFYNEYLTTAGRINFLLGLNISDGTLIIDLASINDTVWSEYLTNLAVAPYFGNPAFNYAQANAAYVLHTIIEQVVYANI